MNNAKALPKTVFILSDNRDFIEPLSSLVTRELGLSCKSIAREEEISGQAENMLVTDRSIIGNYKLPIITVNLPVRIKALFADIKAILDQEAAEDFLDITPDLQLTLKHKLLTYKKSGQVDLTDKESQLLQIISQSGDSGIAKEILLKEVWGFDSALDTHTLETHIYRLRKKIRDNFDIDMIKSFEGGYRL